MEKLNPETWARRDAFAFFSRVSNPFYMVTFRQDVTALFRYTKANRLSFYYAMCWACTEALNRVDGFLVSVEDGELVRLPGRRASFTDIRPGEEQFYFVNMPAFGGDAAAFCREAAERSRTRTGFLDTGEGSDLVYLSCSPVLDLTACSNERDLTAPNATDDAIPRVNWGRFTERDGRRTLGLSMEVNHRFIDGFHIARFAEHLTNLFESL